MLGPSPASLGSDDLGGGDDAAAAVDDDNDDVASAEIACSAATAGIPSSRKSEDTYNSSARPSVCAKNGAYWRNRPPDNVIIQRLTSSCSQAPAELASVADGVVDSSREDDLLPSLCSAVDDEAGDVGFLDAVDSAC